MYRFPYFETLMWYVASGYVPLLRSISHQVSDREVQGLTHLVTFLESRLRILADPSSDRREFVEESIPDCLKIPKQLYQPMVMFLSQMVNFEVIKRQSLK